MKGDTGGAFRAKEHFLLWPQSHVPSLMNVMFPRKAEPTKVRPVAFESCTPPHSCVYLQSTEGMLAGERHNLSTTNLQMLHSVVGSCLQVPGFAHEKSNLLRFSEEKLEKTSSWLTQSHPMTKFKISTGGHGLDVHPNVSFWDRQGSWCPKLYRDHHSFLSMAWSSNTGGTRLSLSSPPSSIISKAQPLSPQHWPSQLSDLHSIWNLFCAKLNPQSLCQPEITVGVATYDASDINGK